MTSGQQKHLKGCLRGLNRASNPFSTPIMEVIFMARDLNVILKELDDLVKDDSMFMAETLEEFDKLQNEHYRRIGQLIAERNQAQAEIIAKEEGLEL